jgi:N-acetylglucosaminyldiphosphoundecaprenol N-acetyl-beta-D-mannosaminyltransferase
MAGHRGHDIHYIRGARRELLETAVQRLREAHPRLRIAGYSDGYFTDEQSPEVAAAIRDSGAQILFVAMSTPRKEHWLGEYGLGLRIPFVMGVGGAIDIVAGITRRAPRAWQRLGIEWLYRVFQEPRRMFRRYLITNVKFSVMVARALVLRGLGSAPRSSG